jgi:hypothetical protein
MNFHKSWQFETLRLMTSTKRMLAIGSESKHGVLIAIGTKNWVTK